MYITIYNDGTQKDNEKHINRFKNNITIDIIKNIKRNLSNNKKNIYESELSKERYEYYLNLQKQFTETIV